MVFFEVAASFKAVETTAESFDESLAKEETSGAGMEGFLLLLFAAFLSGIAAVKDLV